MKCYVNNVRYDQKKLIYRDQGFGSNPGKPLLPITLEISNNEIINLLSETFASFVKQCEKDDKEFGEIDIPELHQLNYPSFEEMINHSKSLLARLLKEFLYFHLLDAITKNNLREMWQFSINEISDVKWDDGGFLLEGNGYLI